MKISDLVSFSLQDIKRRKKRIVLTSFGITLGSVLIILMVSLGLFLNQFLVSTVNSGSQTKTLKINAVKADAAMPENTREAAENMPNWMKENFKRIDEKAVKDMAHIKNVTGVEAYIEAQVAEVVCGEKTRYGTFPVKGYDLDYDTHFKSDVENAGISSKNPEFKSIIVGEALKKGDTGKVLVGESLLKTLGFSSPENCVGKNLTIRISNINGTPVAPFEIALQVKGVTSRFMPDGNKLVVDAQTAADIAGFLQYTDQFFEEYGYNCVTLEGKTLDDLETIADSVNEIGYYAQSINDKTEEINDSFKDITFVLSILGAIVIVVAGIGIVNTMIMAVHERKKSIGIMKAVGAGRAEIRKIFIFQSGAIGFIGSVLGALLSTGLFKLISSSIVRKLLKEGNAVDLMQMPPVWLVGGTILFSVVIAVIAGIYPSERASKMDPVEALRG